MKTSKLEDQYTIISDRGVGPRGVSGIDFFKKTENYTSQISGKKCQKDVEMIPEKCSGGVETSGWIKMALRMQWNASRTPKRP